MALYAYDKNELTAAWDADPKNSYQCLECSLPVKVRRTKSRIAHFYHVQLSPSCRLYSKSEDHLVLQLQIQSLLPPQEALIERPFPSIGRIGDVAWGAKKIVFEIQYSQISLKEAERRTEEYRSLGWNVIWILDDRAYNKKRLRPPELWLRCQSAYYVSFRRSSHSLFYDQFEIFFQKQRLKKSRRLPIDLSCPRLFPQIETPSDWPLQVLQRLSAPLYFPGDRVHRALLSAHYPSYWVQLEQWRAFETELPAQKKGKEFLKKWIAPYLERLDACLSERA